MKKNLLRLLLFCTFACWHVGTLTAQDSSHLRISLLTCTPGDELYSTFGHSALRVTDSGSRQDIVFNYGTFNFDDPDFYSKFVRGKLMYFVSTSYFNEFKEDYRLTNRGITEQVLNLSAEEKTAVQKFLYNNAREENRYYKYDFLFDNCTTRLRDIVVRNKKTTPLFKDVVPHGTTFRNAIHGYLNKNDKEWDKLGIDILLGAPTDAVMETMQQQFLPDNLMAAFDSCDAKPALVSASYSLYPFQQPEISRSWFNPMIVFSGLLLLLVALDFSKTKFAAVFFYGFDGMLFFVTGALGVLLLFMWLGTDHAMCKNNYNLLWAWPTHAVAAVFINRKNTWLQHYMKLTAAGLLILMAAWIFLPQQLNSSLVPVCLLMLYRALRRSQK